MRVVLASSSPRRQQLLEMAGYEVVVRTPAVDEGSRPGENTETMLRRLAEAKCRAVGDSEDPIVAADTVVEIEGEVLGKPSDEEDARRMLRRLSGREHSVLTGFAVRRGDVVRTAVVRTTVKCRELSAASIDAYIMTGDPLDKAGAYGIQSAGAAMVEAVNGSYTNVVGLPLNEVETELRG